VTVFVVETQRYRSNQISVDLAIVGMDKFDGGSPYAVGDRVPGEFLPGPVEQRPATVTVDPEDHLADILHDGPVAGFTFNQGGRGGPTRSIGKLETGSVAVQDQADERGDGGHRRDSDGGCQERGQIRAHGRELDQHRGGDTHQAGSDDGDREPPAVEERQGECDSHDRRGGEARNRRREQGQDENHGQYHYHEQNRRSLPVTPKRLTTTLG
jgi:hypothetical protein